MTSQNIELSTSRLKFKFKFSDNDVSIEPVQQASQHEAYVDSIVANIPDYEHIQITPKSKWNDMPGDVFANEINTIYEETVKWKKNLFKVPTGNAAKQFISELTIWLEHFNKGTTFQGIALKVFMILPNLMLQKPSQNSKSKDHVSKLSERLEMWKAGQLSDLLREGRQIQYNLRRSKQRTPEKNAKIFSKLIFEGKINAALKFLSTDIDCGVLSPTPEIMAELIKKHPDPSPIAEDVLLNGPIDKVLPSHFDSIDEETIAKAANLTHGAGGPSQLDADQYRHILLSRKYKKEGNELRKQIALLAKKLATRLVNPDILEAFTACRLIPLNKNPGVRPIGIGEVLRRLIGKSISWVLKSEIQEAAGPLQASTGLKGGAEAAIHSMREIYEHDTTDAVILVDASNAFNRLNRQAALHNIQVIAPAFSTILINTYRQPSRLFVTGGKELLSKEGTTQGDNLAMALYGLATVPLQNRIRFTETLVKQVWLADDAIGAGVLENLRNWWDTINNYGPGIGYYVNEPKSWLILKDSSKLEEAESLFRDTSIRITASGKRHLGAAIGSTDFRHEYATEKVNHWCEEVSKLAEFALSQPHAAFSAYIHGEHHRFSYFMRTIPGMETYLQPLDNIVNEKLLPAILGSTITDIDRQLFSLPIRDGGLGIPILTERAVSEFHTSMEVNAPLAAIMIMQRDQLPDENEQK